jgi:hypothetical protein
MCRTSAVARREQSACTTLLCDESQPPLLLRLLTHHAPLPSPVYTPLLSRPQTGVAEDPFGRQLLAAGIDEATIRAWCLDPRVQVRRGCVRGGSGRMTSDMCGRACVVVSCELTTLLPAPSRCQAAARTLSLTCWRTRTARSVWSCALKYTWRSHSRRPGCRRLPDSRQACQARGCGPGLRSADMCGPRPRALCAMAQSFFIAESAELHHTTLPRAPCPCPASLLRHLCPCP